MWVDECWTDKIWGIVEVDILEKSFFPPFLPGIDRAGGKVLVKRLDPPR
jgi:hypothetical protein